MNLKSMQKCLVALPIAFAWFWILGTRADAGLICSGHEISVNGRIEGTGLNENLQFDARSFDLNFTASGCGSLLGSEHRISYGAGATGLEEYQGMVNYSVSNGLIRMSLDAQATGGPREFKPRARAQLNIQYSDTLRLVGVGDAPFSDLVISATATGIADTENGMSGAFSASVNATSIRFNTGIDFDGPFILSPSAAVRLDSQRQAEFSFGVSAFLGGQTGVGRINSSNSTLLTSILFPDGSTPESHGFEIQFASGMASPNVTVSTVPEPSTFATALLLLGLTATARYRSNNKVR